MDWALQGLIAMQQPQPCSCSCAGGSLSTLSAGPTQLPQQPWCCRDRVIPPPEPHFSRTQVGSLCFDGSPRPQHPPKPCTPRQSSLPSISVSHCWGLWEWSPRPQSPPVPQCHPADGPHSNHPAAPFPPIPDSAHTLAEGSFGWKTTPAKGISRSWLRSLQFWLPLLLVLLNKDPQHLELLQPGHAGCCPSTSSCAADCDLPVLHLRSCTALTGAALFRFVSVF